MSPFWISVEPRIMQVAMTTAAIGHAKLWSHRHYKNTNTQLFTGWMPFLLPNQQCQSNEEEKVSHSTDLPKLPGVSDLVFDH